jgi:hypothetical protein
VPKSAIINIARQGMLENLPLKKLLLFFDRLYVDNISLLFAEQDIKMDKTFSLEEKRIFLTELDWLKEQGLIQTYMISQEDFKKIPSTAELDKDIQALNKDIHTHLIPASSEETKDSQSNSFKFAGVLAATNDLVFNMEDMRLRIAAEYLNVTIPSTQFAPIVNSFNSYQTKQTHDQALHFVLEKMPVPDSNVPWEMVLEFRNDSAIQRKYYALLNWINEVSQQNLPLPHLIDQYHELYHEYVHQYSLYNLTKSYTTVELLVFGIMDAANAFLQNNFATAFKILLNIRKENVALLKSEKDIQGRELAYIFAANEKFKPI